MLSCFSWKYWLASVFTGWMLNILLTHTKQLLNCIMKYVWKSPNNECWLKMIPVWSKEYEMNIFENYLTIHVAWKLFPDEIQYNGNWMNKMNTQINQKYMWSENYHKLGGRLCNESTHRLANNLCWMKMISEWNWYEIKI